MSARPNYDRKGATMPTVNRTQTAKRGVKASQGFTAEEKAAMKERAKEARASKSKADAESEVLAKITAMQKEDRVLAERFHAIVKGNAPELSPRTWYGMPAYTKDGKVLCYFRDAKKFKTRYATFGFSDQANLDDGAMWPTDFALTEITPEVEKKIAKLIKRALS
jgi:uncharacterized protein YdhG (YjbR/CyaY superfamily)